MPRQGDGAPWMMSSSYTADVKLLRSDSVLDPNLRFDTGDPVAAATRDGGDRMNDQFCRAGVDRRCAIAPTATLRLHRCC